MLVRIMAVNPEGTEAYAEKIIAYEQYEDDDECYVTAVDGSCYWCDPADVRDIPDHLILKKISGEWLWVMIVSNRVSGEFRFVEVKGNE